MFKFLYQKLDAIYLSFTLVRASLKHCFLESKQICSGKQGGFTALETMVVLAIVAMMTSLAVPRLQAVSAQRDVDVVASEIAQQMEWARIYSQSYSVVVNACPVNVLNLNDALPNCLALGNNDNWSAWVWIAPVNGVNSVIMRSDVVPASVRMTSTRPNVLFNRDGIANGSNLTVTVASNQAQVLQQVTLAPSGRVTLTSNAVNTSVAAAAATSQASASSVSSALPTLIMSSSTSGAAEILNASPHAGSAEGAVDQVVSTK